MKPVQESLWKATVPLVYVCIFAYFETGSHCVAPAGLRALQYTKWQMNAKQTIRVSWLEYLEDSHGIPASGDFRMKAG